VTLTPSLRFSAAAKERVELYLYSAFGPYGLYRASVPVQYSYTSTPPMGHTACTEPQCLYRGALYLYFFRPHAAEGVFDALWKDYFISQNQV